MGMKLVNRNSCSRQGCANTTAVAGRIKIKSGLWFESGLELMRRIVDCSDCHSLIINFLVSFGWIRPIMLRGTDEIGLAMDMLSDYTSKALQKQFGTGENVQQVH
ncbi:hypothetical protein M8C21_025595 [Ambrosia artemisiifolia]|uniref:Uncharacterized protein n=1 Tax=Ambrosia artemisiifolia TaxID=4212 RepID=A0AAD5BZT2_AMBAR|nr:hypothetical protein M8C21_025595 [Ambrosia artemisiifolia]